VQYGAVQIEPVIWDHIRLNRVYVKLYKIIGLVIHWPVIMSELCVKFRVCKSVHHHTFN